MMPIQCITCKHYQGDSRCLAFPEPDEIPAEILTGEISHSKPFPGQVGKYVWTPGESEEARRARGEKP